jgi:uncharacterized protein (UPF0332 family)
VTDHTSKLLAKAARFISSAQRSVAESDFESGASRAYYAMFYVAEALLSEEGLHYRRHGGVHGAFGERFAKTGRLDRKYHRWLLEAFEQRITADYGVDAVLTADDVAALIDHADEFLRAARRCLGLG